MTAIKSAPEASGSMGMPLPSDMLERLLPSPLTFPVRMAAGLPRGEYEFTHKFLDAAAGPWEKEASLGREGCAGPLVHGRVASSRPSIPLLFFTCARFGIKVFTVFDQASYDFSSIRDSHAAAAGLLGGRSREAHLARAGASCPCPCDRCRLALDEWGDPLPDIDQCAISLD